MEKVVLIVENNLMSIFLLRKYISNEGCRVISAEDGFKAVCMFQDYVEIGLVIMDIDLPTMNGIEAMRKMKELKKDLPVILHSAYSRYKETTSNCGCDEFINETLTREIIRDLLKKYLND